MRALAWVTIFYEICGLYGPKALLARLAEAHHTL